jgi:hypothetical protein
MGRRIAESPQRPEVPRQGPPEGEVRVALGDVEALHDHPVARKGRDVPVAVLDDHDRRRTLSK